VCFFLIIAATPLLLLNSAGAPSVVRTDVLIFNQHIFKVFCKAVHKSVAIVVSLSGTEAANS
jgi:hypothetical protein